MKLRLSLLALLFALVTGTAFAHGNKVHVRGTVEKISADSVVVKTADGKSVEVKFAASTVFLSRSNNEDKPAKAGDLAPGNLVVIHRSEEHTSELQSQSNLVCRLLLEKKKKKETHSSQEVENY